LPKWMKCLVAALAVDAMLLVLIPVLIGRLIAEPSAPPFDDPNPGAGFKVVALGDSYISGEGTMLFFSGTDRPGVNTCRRSPAAYPYIVAVQLRASLQFAACSGARAAHILDTPQQPVPDPVVPGGEPQVDVLRQQPDADVVLLSIGGNDAGFGRIGKSCVLRGDCRRDADYWLTSLDQEVYPRLVRVFDAVADTSDAEVFVMTYPDPLGPRDCAALPLDPPEHGFLKTEFIPRLNLLIEFAAAVSQVRVIHLEHALDGHRICEVGPRKAAVNILGLGRTRGSRIDVHTWAHNSFHPNELGHRLIARIVGEEVRRFMTNRLPPLPPPPPPGISPPPSVPSEIGPPVGPYAFPPNTGCIGDEITRVVPVAAPSDVREVPIRILDAQPDSIVCYRDYKAAWRITNASPSGEVTLEVDAPGGGVASISEVLYRSLENIWIKVVVRRVGSSSTPSGGWDVRLRAGAMALVGFVVAVNVLVIRRCARATRAVGQSN
jgi:hypothetical protein